VFSPKEGGHEIGEAALVKGGLKEGELLSLRNQIAIRSWTKRGSYGFDLNWCRCNMNRCRCNLNRCNLNRFDRRYYAVIVIIVDCIDDVLIVYRRRSLHCKKIVKYLLPPIKWIKLRTGLLLNVSKECLDRISKPLRTIQDIRKIGMKIIQQTYPKN